MDFNFGAPAVPFDTAPSGTQMAGLVVIGRRPDGSLVVEQRLPSGMAFDPNDPAHVFGWFVVNSAQDLMTHAMAMRRQAAAVHQVDETIVSKQLVKG